MASDPKAAPVQIRPAHESDIPELARLIAAIGAYHEAIDDRVRVDWDEIRDAPNWLKRILNRDHHAIWVAEHLAAGVGDGKLVGYLWVRLHRQRNGYLPKVTGYIANAFLEEAWRGKGLMKPMLELAYDWFRDKEITVVTLGVLHRNWIGSRRGTSSASRLGTKSAGWSSSRARAEGALVVVVIVSSAAAAGAWTSPHVAGARIASGQAGEHRKKLDFMHLYQPPHNPRLPFHRFASMKAVAKGVVGMAAEEIKEIQDALDTAFASFRQANPEVAEAMRVLNISSEEYLRAISGLRPDLGTSTGNSHTPA